MSRAEFDTALVPVNKSLVYEKVTIFYFSSLAYRLVLGHVLFHRIYQLIPRNQNVFF
jgi:hypothetical protein